MRSSSDAVAHDGSTGHMRRDRGYGHTALLCWLPVVGVDLTDTPGEAVLLKATGPGSLCSRAEGGAARTREARGLGRA
jgi:hypothetical protein